MSNYLSNSEAPKEQHLGSPHFSSNRTTGQFSKKLKRTILESPHREIGGELSRLPKDIVLDIFSRLSVKDLKNCIPVRKSWYQTVLSPNFTKLYYEKSVINGAHTVSFIIQDDVAFEESTEYDLYLVQREPSSDSLLGICEVIPLRTKFKEMNVKYELVGSCQGLLCLCEPPLSDPVYICNPVIGEYMTLPSAPEEVDVDIISGFGYDSIAGVCKVIRMVYRPMEIVDKQISYNLEAEVYSVGLKNWRKIGFLPYRPSADNPGVFSNGFIHWLSDSVLCEEESCGIVCFNVSSEQFNLIPLPPGYGKDYLASEFEDGRIFELLDIKGHLCLSDEKGDDTVVWVMKEYGVEQSWTKELALDDLFRGCHVLKSISGLPSMYESCNHVVCLISYMDANEDAEGQEGYNKLETWSTNLCAIPSPDIVLPPNSPRVITSEEPLSSDDYAPAQSQASGNPDDNAIPATISDDENNGGLRPEISLYEFCKMLGYI